jgi:hypothetical protein
MAAVLAVEEVPHIRERRKRDIPIVGCRLVERRREHDIELNTRIRALVGSWEAFIARENAKTSSGRASRHQGITRDIFRPYGSSALRPDAPPEHEDALLDAPPEYTSTDAYAAVVDLLLGEARIEHGQVDRRNTDETRQLFQDVDIKLDFSAAENIRSRANKKAKKVSGAQL